MAFLPVIETITTNPELHGFMKQSKNNKRLHYNFRAEILLCFVAIKLM